MRSLSPQVLDLLDAGTLKLAEMLRFDLGTGQYGFWTGRDDLIHGGLTYRPGGIIKVSSIEGQLGMMAQGLTIELAASPNDGLTPDVLATMEQEVWHQRPVTISEIFFHPETSALLFVEPLYRGFIDTIEYTQGDDAKLIAQCESRALDNSRENYRMRSLNDQHLIDGTDDFYSFVENAGKEVIPWGQDPNANAGKPKKKKKFLGLF